MPVKWTPARTAKLETCWKQGLQAREIAKLLGSDITRSAVLGKVNRMALTRADPAGKVFSFPSASECRWPEGHPGEDDFSFCRRKVAPGKPYCLEHCELAYRKRSS